MSKDFIDSVAPPLHRANSLRWLLPAMSQTPPRNRLLAALSTDEYQRLSLNLECVTLSLGQVLHEPNQAIEYAYFPVTAVISYLNVMEAGHSFEMAAIGNEGMIGVPFILRTDRIAMQAMVQTAGSAMRISAKALRLALQDSPSLQVLLLRYVQTLMSQIAQDLACTQLHSHQERCCYLLLMLHDRTGNSVLPLTHDLLARIVGVKRSRIGEIITTLERAGLVQHQRGRLTIINRAGLEAAACECYQILRSQFDCSFR